MLPFCCKPCLISINGCDALTFSILARDPSNGRFGVAVATCHLADGWWQQLSVQGYSDLILRSVTGAELGRTARIGSGMVVNSPLP